MLIQFSTGLLRELAHLWWMKLRVFNQQRQLQTYHPRAFPSDVANNASLSHNLIVRLGERRLCSYRHLSSVLFVPYANCIVLPLCPSRNLPNYTYPYSRQPLSPKYILYSSPLPPE